MITWQIFLVYRLTERYSVQVLMGYGFPSSFFHRQGPGFKVAAVTVLTALGTAAAAHLPAESGMSNPTLNSQPGGQAADVSPFCQTLVAHFSPFGNSDQAILSAALDQGGDLNQPCLLYGEQWLPLNYLLSTDEALAQRLIDQGVDVNAQDGMGSTPLHYVGASPTLAQTLLLHGANVNARNQNGITPLHNVFGEKNMAVMALLIEAGAEVNAQNNEQLTPLHLAYNTGSPEIADLLIRHGADVNARTNLNYTPLHYAVSANSGVGVAERLLQAGADLTLQNDAGAVIHTPYFDPAVLQLLLDYGADVNLANAAGHTPLHVHRFNPELIGPLLAAGANLMVQDHQGRTALHQAVLEEQSFFGPELVALFLGQAQPRSGLVQVRDYQGKTALDLAQRLGKTEMVNLLQTVSEQSLSE